MPRKNSATAAAGSSKSSEQSSGRASGKGGKPTTGVKELVQLGRSKGYVTYDDVNELLDDEVTNENEIEDVLLTLRESHVEVRDGDSPAAAEPVPVRRRTKRSGEREAEEGAATTQSEEGGTDYVRMYMRDIPYLIGI